MKTSRNSNNHQSKQGLSNRPRPEIRDNLDSRERVEQHVKGDHITHNEKAKRSE